MIIQLHTLMQVRHRINGATIIIFMRKGKRPQGKGGVGLTILYNANRVMNYAAENYKISVFVM